jgi:hypothetical protein
MPNYITRPDGYELVLPAPYTQKDANARLYLMSGNTLEMQATANRYLNGVAAPGTFYTPLGNIVVAAFMAIREVRCSVTGLGSMHEVDCAFFLPLIKWKSGLPSDVAFFAPYLFVNNSWAMATGREVHGFRKDVAHSFSDLDVNKYDSWSHAAKDLTHIDAWAMDPKSALSRLEIQRLVELHGPDPAPPGDPLVDAFITLILGILGDLGPLGAALAALPVPSGFPSWLMVVAQAVVEKLTTTDANGDSALRLPMLFLRQFCDPANSTQADVQSLVEADMVAPFSSMSASLPGGTFRLKFFDKASHPIAKELGLSAEETSNLTVDATLDFQLQNS